MFNKSCKYCHEDFTANNKRALYCSIKCKNKQKSDSIMMKRRGNEDAYNAYQRQWRSENASHCSKWHKDRYKNNSLVREQKIKLAKKWHRNNLERHRENNKRYYLSNYTRFAAANLSRHSRQIMDQELVKQIFERDNYTCQYCFVRGGKLTIDHKLPVSRSGTNDLYNLCVACHSCNCRKGAKTVEEFTAYLSLC